MENERIRNELLLKVIQFIIETTGTSTLQIQAKFKISYATVTRLLDQMVLMKIISEYEERKPIKLLITEEDANKVIKDMKYPERLSSEYRLEQYKNIPIEQMDSQTLFDRYIANGSNEELGNPIIQRLLIQHGHVDAFTEVGPNIITDKEVIKDIFKSNLLEDETITYKEGRIDNVVPVIEDEGIPNSTDKIYRVYIEFEDSKTQEKCTLKRRYILHNKRDKRIQKQPRILKKQCCYNSRI